MGSMADGPALQTFVAVARSGSVVAAAGRLARTQPSISARLSALERRWDTKLFRRHARGMTLTPEGARLLPLAEAALSGLAALDGAAGVPLAGNDELRIGSGDALGREVVPRAIAALLRRQPTASIRILEGPAPALQEALRAGDVDLVMTVGSAGTESRGLIAEPLLESPVDLLVPPASRFPATVDLERLRGVRLVTLQRGSGFRRHLELAFAAAGVPFHPAVEVGNLSLVRRFVLAGLGVGLVPAVAFATPSNPRRKERRRLRGVPPVPYVVLRRDGVPPTALAARFLGLLTERGR